uniref:Uncharacterized protein n=1 Tax=Solanum tuberosum TaxID=4113 RepID=M1E107_SOLTU
MQSQISSSISAMEIEKQSKFQNNPITLNLNDESKRAGSSKRKEGSTLTVDETKIDKRRKVKDVVSGRSGKHVVNEEHEEGREEELEISELPCAIHEGQPQTVGESMDGYLSKYPGMDNGGTYGPWVGPHPVVQWPQVRAKISKFTDERVGRTGPIGSVSILVTRAWTLILSELGESSWFEEGFSLL